MIYVIIFLGLWLVGGLKIYVLYWVVPFVTWFQFINRIRTIAEHNAVKKNALIGTRTTIATWFDKLFIVGFNHPNYHIEHHLYPSVPFYNLPKLHKLLIKDETFKSRAHITAGYHNVILECLKK